MEEGADFIVAETFDVLGEAELALECIKSDKNEKSYKNPNWVLHMSAKIPVPFLTDLMHSSASSASPKTSNLMK